LKIFFASGGKGALTPLTKILRTFLVAATGAAHNPRRVASHCSASIQWAPAELSRPQSISDLSAAPRLIYTPQNKATRRRAADSCSRRRSVGRIQRPTVDKREPFSLIYSAILQHDGVEMKESEKQLELYRRTRRRLHVIYD